MAQGKCVKPFTRGCHVGITQRLVVTGVSEYGYNRFAETVDVIFGDAGNVNSTGADNVDGKFVAKGVDLFFIES